MFHFIACFIYLLDYFSIYLAILFLGLTHFIYCLKKKSGLELQLVTVHLIQTVGHKLLENHHCYLRLAEDNFQVLKAPPRCNAKHQSRDGLWEAGSQTDRQTRQIHGCQIHCSCDLNVSLSTLWPSWLYLYALLHLWVLLQFSQNRTCHLSDWLIASTGYGEDKPVPVGSEAHTVQRWKWSQ